MRSLWLASAAIFITAGAALAQTTPSPAPTGAPNAAQTAPAGSTASPGNMAPTAPSVPQDSSTNTTGSTASSSSPAPTGAPNGANVTQPGASPGNMAPPKAASNAAPAMTPIGAATPEAMPPHHMAMSHGMTMPADADARTYLHIASMAIKHGDKATADEALSRAETRVLTRAVPATDSNPTDDSPAVNAIEQARMAVKAGNMQGAAMDTKTAMHAMHGGMGPMAASSTGAMTQ